jgi:hypothetical protein
MKKSILLLLIFINHNIFSQNTNLLTLLEVSRSDDHWYNEGTDIIVNLTEEGTLDWLQCGQSGQNQPLIVRKANIQDTIIGKPFLVGQGVWRTYPGEPSTVCTWTDGDPIATGEKVDGGWWFRNNDNPGTGFGVAFAIAADTSLIRTVKFYCGRWKAKGKINVRLSDDSAPAYTHTSDFGNSVHNTYTIRYRAAAPGQNLIIEWRNSGLIEDKDGNVQMIALTVSQEIGTSTATNQFEATPGGIEVYPNPAGGSTLMIKLSGIAAAEEIVNVAIYSMSGIKVYQAVYPTASLINIVPNIKQGMYLIKVNNNVQKIVIQ